MAGTVVLLLSLALVFALEGAIVGKLLPTTAIFPAYILMFNVTIESVVFLTILSATAATVGQYVIFRFVKDRPETSQTGWLRTKVYNNRWYQKSRQYFKRVTPTTLLLSNIVPGLRGLLMIPLAESKEHDDSFVITAAFIGNILHFALSGMLVLSGWYTITAL